MKRKLAMLLLALASALCVAIALPACDLGGSSNGQTEHIHTFTHVSAVEPTCTESGNIEYWFCSGCNTYSTDANDNNTTTLAQVTIKPTGHNFIDGICSKCNALYYTEGLEYSLSPDSEYYTVEGIGTATDNDVVIPSIYNNLPVTEIGRHAFNDCRITSVTIPESVTNIDHYAFSHCSNLTSVTFGDSSQLTSICEYAFVGCNSLTSITIPEGVTSIDDGAFWGCTDLTSITIPDSVTSIGNQAFYNCSNLTSVAFGDNSHLTSIGMFAFLGCTSLTGITIPESVTNIDNNTFRGCSNLASITIPESITSIGGEAFSYCRSLTSVTIPDSVTSIDSSAFGGCISLTIYCEATSRPSGWNTDWNWNGHVYCPVVWNCNNNEIADDGYIYVMVNKLRYGLKDGNATVAEQPSNTYGNIAIPSIVDYKGLDYIVTNIGSSAFEDCAGLESVTIPESATSIGISAFKDCAALTEINFNATTCNDLSSYKNNVFYNAGQDGEGITVNIGANVTKIPAYLFYHGSSSNSPKIVSVNFAQNSVCESIGNGAFGGCSSLTSITIPEGVTSIGNDAFGGCDGLKAVYTTDLKKWCDIKFKNYYANPLYYAHNLYLNGELVTELIIPDGITEIKDYVFCGCSSLTSITIPDSVISVGSEAFFGCDGLKTVYITDIEAWCNISFGDSYSDSEANPLCYGANLYLNGELVTELIIPDGITEIKDYMFCGCTSFTNITIPDSVTSIGSQAFSDCNSLTSITIPESVTSIGDRAFENCNSLESIYYKGTAEDWANINIEDGEFLTEATIYYYSETEPTDEGNYWHYVDGVAAAW